MAGASSLRRIVINRAAFAQIDLALADGLFEFGKRVVFGAQVPDAPPYGEGLLQGGGVVAYLGRKKVAQDTVDHSGAAVKKPRAAKLTATGATVIGGFGFPGRFVEEGTNDTRAEPFLTPELMAAVPEAAPLLKAACIRHKVVGQARAARGDVFGASKVKP